MIGETYESDRTEKGWRFLAEQVCVFLYRMSLLLMFCFYDDDDEEKDDDNESFRHDVKRHLSKA